MIKVITFDLWNTLFLNKSYMDIRLDFFIQFLKKKNKFSSYDKICHAFNSAFHLSDIYFEDNNFRHIYTHERILRLLNIINIELSRSEIIELQIKFEEMMLTDPPPLIFSVKETLNELSKDYIIGLISNTGITPGRVIKKVFQKYDIQKYFKITLFSDETGFFKPNPIMFETILKEFNCIPQNAIHIGDKLETDVKGAKDCKMFTIWINDSNSLKSEEILPDYEIQKIYDVVKIVKDIP
ncbi:MAG: HAD family hydrolase [Candidatus Thorarchaeota archaeon]